VIKTKVKERYGGGWSQLIRNRNNAE
jgi:hypothetical protein